MADSVKELACKQDNQQLTQIAGKSFRVKVTSTVSKMKTKDCVDVIEQLDLTAMQPHLIDLVKPEVVLRVLIHKAGIILGRRVATSKLPST